METYVKQIKITMKTLYLIMLKGRVGDAVKKKNLEGTTTIIIKSLIEFFPKISCLFHFYA